MKAYMIRTKKKIEPFGDHPGDCLISNNELKAIQKSVLDDMALNLAIVEDNNSIKDSEEHIIFTDSLYFNRKLLETFISESRKTQQRTVCALHTGVTTLRTVVNTQDVTRKEAGYCERPGIHDRIANNSAVAEITVFSKYGEVDHHAVLKIAVVADL